MRGSPAQLSVQTGRGGTPPSPAADARAPPVTACRTRSPCPRHLSPSLTRRLPTPGWIASSDREGEGEEERGSSIVWWDGEKNVFWVVGLFKLRGGWFHLTSSSGTGSRSRISGKHGGGGGGGTSQTGGWHSWGSLAAPAAERHHSCQRLHSGSGCG